MLKRSIAALLMLFAVCAGAADLTFSKVTITLAEDNRIMLDAQLLYELNDTATEALENGVPLTFETHIEMRAADAWIWSSDVVEYRLRSVLRYRPLSALYEVRLSDGEDKHVFATRASALRFMGQVRQLALIDRSLLDADTEYLVRLNAHLDIEVLPLPMRPRAYISSDWDISAEPWEWQLKP